MIGLIGATFVENITRPNVAYPNIWSTIENRGIFVIFATKDIINCPASSTTEPQHTQTRGRSIVQTVLSDSNLSTS